MNLFPKKMPIQRHELFTGLDIGSSKICCAIARLDSKEAGSEGEGVASLRVIGVGYQVSKGIKSGVITDLEALEDSILTAVQTAEQSAGQNIDNVYVSLPASVTQSHILKTEIQVFGSAIDESHLRRLLTVNCEGVVSPDRQVIHILPLSYTLDSIQGIRDPRGMVGENLSAFVHVISAPVGFLRNLSGCIGRCHLDVAAYVSSAYACSLATLVEDELELGVTVIDMGGAQTTLASFMEGALVNITSIPLGAANITNDIARGLGTPLSQAERLKTLYGTLIPSATDDRESIFVHSLGEATGTPHHHIPKGTLTHVINSRVEEILELVVRKIQTSAVDPLVYQRFVMTGGGSQLQGLRERAMQLLNKQVRVGVPMSLTGTFDILDNPAFSTCAGLLQYGLQDYNGDQVETLTTGNWSWARRMVIWFKENF